LETDFAKNSSIIVIVKTLSSTDKELNHSYISGMRVPFGKVLAELIELAAAAAFLFF